MDQAFRKLRIRSPDHVDKRWLDWFRDEFSRNMFKSEVDIDGARPFRLDATIRMLPDLVLYNGSASPMRTIAAAEARHEATFGIGIAVAGEMTFRAGKRELTPEPGGAMFGRPVDMLDTRSDTRILSIRLSPRLLAPLIPNLSDMPQLAVMPSGSQLLRLLISYLGMLEAQESIELPESQHLVAQHVHDLVALALQPSRDVAELAQGRGGGAARIAALHQDVERSLSDPRT